MNVLTHIDLFSGIGGFALAAGWAGFRTIAFCEIDPFCQEVLKARFGAVADTDISRKASSGSNNGMGWKRKSVPMLIPDIFAFDGTRFRGATLLTGGFPCQPFSHAGKRRGKADDRALWPQMLRVIHEARPAWVIGENVSGLISMELDSVLADLEMEGYAARTFHIGAVGVNAPHRRMRVFICAHNTKDSIGIGSGGGQQELHLRRKENEYQVQVEGPDSVSPDSDVENAIGGGWRPRRTECSGLRGGPSPDGPDSDAPDAEGRETQSAEPRGFHPESGGENKYAPDAEVAELDGGRQTRPGRSGLADGNSWDIPWIEVATRLCRVDDGLPAWVHARRVARLKALGNAIVPQVAHEIVRAIAEIERKRPC